MLLDHIDGLLKDEQEKALLEVKEAAAINVTLEATIVESSSSTSAVTVLAPPSGEKNSSSIPEVTVSVVDSLTHLLPAKVSATPSITVADRNIEPSSSSPLPAEKKATPVDSDIESSSINDNITSLHDEIKVIPTNTDPSMLFVNDLDTEVTEVSTIIDYSTNIFSLLRIIIFNFCKINRIYLLCYCFCFYIYRRCVLQSHMIQYFGFLLLQVQKSNPSLLLEAMLKMKY